MTTTRKRRIVRRAVMALAACVLLVSGYVGSYGTMNWAKGSGWYSRAGQVASRVDEIAFTPLRWYQWSGYPGDRTIRVFGLWCWHRGRGSETTWSDAEAEVIAKERGEDF